MVGWRIFQRIIFTQSPLLANRVIVAPDTWLKKNRIGVYPRMVYRLAIVMPPPPPIWMTENHFRSHFSPFHINTQLLFIYFSQNDCRWPFWMTENHFRSHFSPFQINTQLLFFSQNGCGGHFRWPKITYDRISRHFRSIRNLVFDFFFKMVTGGHFGSPIYAKNNRVLPLCVINGYAKYEIDRWIYDTV